MPESSSQTSSRNSLAVDVARDLLEEAVPGHPTEPLRERLQRLSLEQRIQLFAALKEMPDSAVLTLLYDWSELWARPSQLLPPGDWNTWLILAGRGFGKTRTGAETVRYVVEQGLAKRIALIAPTAADARDTMIEGDSGLLSVCPPWFPAHYEPSKRRVTWRRNGREVARATLFSAEEPERLRGPQHDFAWGDEPMSWLNPEEVWAQLMLGLRLGKKPRTIITGTPKPIDFVLNRIKEEASGLTFVTRGSTYENAANLAGSYLDQIKRLYGGTRLGQQEIDGAVLEEVGNIFDPKLIEQFRVAHHPTLVRIIVAVDPSQTSQGGSDSTGIIVLGLGDDGHAYILEDATLRGTPDEWAHQVSMMFHRYQAESVIAEVNVGGEMVEFTLRTVDESLPVKTVRAMRGKAKRAEPIAALFEQGRVHLVGEHPKLEAQMKTFTGINGRRDDRVDAMCWGLHDLLVTPAFAFV